MSDDRSTPAVTGWFDHSLKREAPTSASGLAREQASGQTLVESHAFRIQSSSAAFHIGDQSVTVVIGEPRDREMRSLAPADCARLLADGANTANSNPLRGRFAVVHVDLKQSKVTLITDRFAVFPICFAVEGSRIAFSDRADRVPETNRREIDPQAIFDYVYFHVVAAPRTIFRGVRRMEPATRMTFDATGVQSTSTWTPVFASDPHFDATSQRERFRALLEQSIAREVTTPRIGAFLSGGTDSSTVVGLLGQVTGEPVDSFSIGFDAGGYDEMSYARLTARHFKSTLHEHYITPDELVRAIPQVAGHYDQPFGNSSALPAYSCARLAREHGVDKLLAGDGGDELFGGNTRYARQKMFGAYFAVPSMVRQRVIEPLLRPALARGLPGIGKIASYVEQARQPMPARMESYNLLDRFGAGAVFTHAFLDTVNTAAPSTMQSDFYRGIAASSIIDRMLAYDWRFTLTDSDLPKVKLSAQLAGEAVGFPLLDDELVDFSLGLPPSMKVRGLTLRYFFKRSLRDFLPEDVIRKKKHGFGLPFGPWLIRDRGLAKFARAALDRLTERGFIRRELVHDLFSVRLVEHPGFYGEMVWVLMMLEHWLERRAPAFKLD